MPLELPAESAGDPFHPPAIATLVGCLHCPQTYESYLIEWRAEANAAGLPQGLWSCPTPGCDGVGFGFDILPVDPDYRDEDGNRMWCGDDEDEDEEGDEWDDAETSPPPQGESAKPAKNDDEPLPW